MGSYSTPTKPLRSDRSFTLGDVKVVETEYHYRFLDWHEHNKPYFSFVTSGFCRETNRKKVFECSRNTLLFHNIGDRHSNVKFGKVSRGISVEIEPAWFTKFGLDLDALPSAIQVSHPEVTLFLYGIYKEARMGGPGAVAATDALLIRALDMLSPRDAERPSAKPAWVGSIDEILRSKGNENISLVDLANELGLHWAHLSREFPRYFKCNFSDYLRKSRVERSLPLLRKEQVSIADIAAICGFSDQSHFTRCFRMYMGTTPGNFRKTASV